MLGVYPTVSVILLIEVSYAIFEEVFLLDLALELFEDISPLFEIAADVEVPPIN